jgi:hypothetical protein
MTGIFSIALLVLQALMFLVWMILAFRWLFALRADAVVASGTTMPGLRQSLRAVRSALTDRRYRTERRRFGLLTLALLGISLLSGLR